MSILNKLELEFEIVIVCGNVDVYLFINEMMLMKDVVNKCCNNMLINSNEFVLMKFNIVIDQQLTAKDYGLNQGSILKLVKL